jgi:hypothetical protein
MIHKGGFMDATMDRLSDKYYGTQISLPNGEGLTIWIRGNRSIPSTRQLELDKVTLSEWQADDFGCDGHYETRDCYDLCRFICNSLKDFEFSK